MENLMLKKIIIAFCSLCVVLFFGIIKESSLLPTSFMHLIHLIIVPKDLHNYLVYDGFLFYNKGHTKTYSLDTKYNDYYELGIVFEEKNMPSGYATKQNYSFNGKLKVDFFSNNSLVLSKTVSTYNSVIYTKGDMNYLEKVSLLRFGVPIMGKYMKDISVKISVLEPDPVLQAYADSAKIYISISGTL
jgi:hypothetical protein